MIARATFIQLNVHRWLLLAAMLAIMTSLVGCAAQRAYSEGQSLIASGQPEAGIAKLQEAVTRDPDHVQYRISLTSQRAKWSQDAVQQGNQALLNGSVTEAEDAFARALRIDRSHPAARLGMEEVRKEKARATILDDAEKLIVRAGGVELIQAAVLLREILSVTPKHARALQLKSRLEDIQKQQGRPVDRLASAFRQPVSLEFRDAPLKSVFDLMAKLSGLNFYFDKEVKTDARTTIQAKNTSLEDAMRVVLAGHQLEHKVLNGNSVLVYPATQAKIKEHQTLVVRGFYVVNADVKQVASTIKTIVKTKDIVFDERIGLVVVRDTPQAVRMAERIVAMQDVTDPEVMLEVEVLEVKRSRLLELGVQWPSQLTLSPLQGAGAPLTLSALRDISSSTTQANVGGLIVNARKEDQDSNILANPRIRVRNKDKARILIGDKVPVITSTSTATGFASESVSYIDVGLKLDVEPTVYLDDDVSIKVNLEVSNLVREVTTKSGALTYQIGTRGAATVLRLKDGETQVLAGLISDEDRASGNKIPGLGDLPLLGRLFGSRKDDAQRNEILLSITPRVLRPLRRPDLHDMEFESGTETSIGAETLRLTSLEPQASSLAPVGAMPSSGMVADATNLPLVFSWQGAEQIKLGEVLSAVLHVDSPKVLESSPVLIEFDPSVWAVNSVMEGSLLQSGGRATSFTSEVDEKRGRITVKASSQGGASSGPSSFRVETNGDNRWGS